MALFSAARSCLGPAGKGSEFPSGASGNLPAASPRTSAGGKTSARGLPGLGLGKAGIPFVREDHGDRDMPKKS